MTRQLKIAVLGATGAVGEALLTILAERAFPASEVVALASSRSAGANWPSPSISMATCVHTARHNVATRSLSSR